MKFEVFIKTISAWVAGIVVFFLASGFYLSMKGFVRDADGNLVLMQQAQARPAVDSATIKNLVLPEGKFIGKASAPVTIYEYSSLGCFHCADFHLQILPKLKADYIDKGMLKVMFVPFPLDKKSMFGSMAANCVADDKYYSFIELLFKKQRDWSLSNRYEEVIGQYAALSGLSKENLNKCMKNAEDYGKTILANRQNAIEYLGIQGTPSFLIVKGNDREVLHGIPSYTILKETLDTKLGLNQKN